MNMLALGIRVRLTRDVERFPDFIAPEGATGIVSHIGNGALWVRLDETLHGAEEWDNAVQFTMEHGDVLPECMEVIA